MAANIVKVYSVGLQGPAGASGSLTPDNSGSFNITGSLNITGSVTGSFFTGSFYGDGGNGVLLDFASRPFRQGMDNLRQVRHETVAKFPIEGCGLALSQCVALA